MHIKQGPYCDVTDIEITTDQLGSFLLPAFDYYRQGDIAAVKEAMLFSGNIA